MYVTTDLEVVGWEGIREKGYKETMIRNEKPAARASGCANTKPGESRLKTRVIKDFVG